jgi:hypothetical protein
MTCRYCGTTFARRLNQHRTYCRRACRYAWHALGRTK